MFSKALLGLAALGLVQETAASHFHRHGVQHAHDKRGVVTNIAYETEVVTVTVWWNGESTSTRKSKTFYTASQRRPSRIHLATTSSTTSTSTSTSSTSTSTSTSTTEAEVPTTSVEAPVVQAVTPTTLVTIAKVPEESSTPIVIATPVVSVAAEIAATVSAAVAAATSALTSTSSSSSNKRGLAYNDHSLLSGFLGTNSKVSWKYNWAQTDDGGSPGLEFVPMLWGTGSNHEPTWATNAEKAIANGAKNFLSFNECDNAGQANMSPDVAAKAHIRLVAPYSGRVRIGAPAITNSNIAGEGIDWIKSFLTACNGACKLDFVPIHWYNYPDATEFLQHLVNVHEAVNLPIWITEFAPINASNDQINAFLKTVMTELDTNSKYSFVERYSYFMVSANSMISSGTTLSTFGNTFAYA